MVSGKIYLESKVGGYNFIFDNIDELRPEHSDFFSFTGLMTIHAGGQQPGQTTAAPSNTLTTTFIITS